jgi:alpha-galactosidase
MEAILQPYGYNYINVDAGWNGGMDGYGRPVPSATLFPGGFTNLINYVHANGQKFGLYGGPSLSKDAYNADLPIYGAPGCSMQDIAALPLRTGDYWNWGYKIDYSNPCAQSYVNSITDLYASWA